MDDTVCIYDRPPDVEAVFRFIGARTRPYADGYRPAHRVTDDYLTTGVHHYNGTRLVPPDGTAAGTITFLTPEAYPHCLWAGKTITVQEGDRIVGYATITKVLNPLLLREDDDT